MIFWIIMGIGILISIAWAVDLVRVDRHDIGGAIACIFFGPIVTFCIAIVLCLIISAIAKGEPDHYSHPDPPGRILALDDHVEKWNDLHGAFVIAVGGIDTDRHIDTSYTFYQEAPDGTYFLHTLKADYDTKIRIKLTGPNVTPTAQRFHPKAHYVTPGWVAPMDLTPDSYDENEKWVITVPRGTIVNHLKLNGK